MIKFDKRIGVLAILLILIITFSAFILSSNLSSSQRLPIFSHTKAICNSTNFCQDYEIHCENNKMMKMSPITGAAVQFPLSWQDPRDELTRNTRC